MSYLELSLIRPELTYVLRYHTARFVRLTLFCGVGSGPMRPIFAPWNRYTLALADAGRLHLPETVRTWLASR
jgi:hypothetical protein